MLLEHACVISLISDYKEDTESVTVILERYFFLSFLPHGHLYASYQSYFHKCALFSVCHCNVIRAPAEHSVRPYGVISTHNVLKYLRFLFISSTFSQIFVARF